jgi:hypothetical protein
MGDLSNAARCLRIVFWLDLSKAARCLRIVFWLMVIFGWLFAIGFFVLLSIMKLWG